jgi:hypothetical protein
MSWGHVSSGNTHDPEFKPQHYQKKKGEEEEEEEERGEKEKEVTIKRKI